MTIQDLKERLDSLDSKQGEIIEILRQLLPSQSQLNLKNLARRVASGDRRALREFNDQRKGNKNI